MNGLFDKLERDPRSKLVAVIAWPLFMAGMAWAVVSNGQERNEQDIREIKRDIVTMWRMEADVKYIAKEVSELKELEQEHHQQIAADIRSIKSALMGRASSPTAMPAAVMPLHAELKAER